MASTIRGAIGYLSPPTPDDERWAAEYPSTNGASAPGRSDRVRRLVVLGYITAFSMPPIGLILGLVLAIRSEGANARHGLWIIALSIVAAIAWVALFTSGALNTTTGDY